MCKQYCSALTQSGNNCKNYRGKMSDFCDIHTTKTCSVCLDTIKCSQKLSCGHSFCVDCINTWIIQKQTCPYCRAPINYQEVQRSKQYGIKNNLIFEYIVREYVFTYLSPTDLTTVFRKLPIFFTLNDINYFHQIQFEYQFMTIINRDRELADIFEKIPYCDKSVIFSKKIPDITSNQIYSFRFV